MWHSTYIRWILASWHTIKIRNYYIVIRKEARNHFNCLIVDIFIHKGNSSKWIDLVFKKKKKKYMNFILLSCKVLDLSMMIWIFISFHVVVYKWASTHNNFLDSLLSVKWVKNNFVHHMYFDFIVIGGWYNTRRVFCFKNILYETKKMF